jgi:hypothetical protein
MQQHQPRQNTSPPSSHQQPCRLTPAGPRRGAAAAAGSKQQQQRGCCGSTGQAEAIWGARFWPLAGPSLSACLLRLKIVYSRADG